MVSGASAAGACGGDLAETGRSDARLGVERLVAPGDDEIRKQIGSAAAEQGRDPLDPLHRPATVEVLEREQAFGDLLQEPVQLGFLDDPVSLSPAEVDPDVPVEIAGDGEGPRLRPIDTARLEARGQLERNPVGQDAGDARAQIRRKSRTKPPEELIRTAAVPAAVVSPESTAASIGGSNSTRLLLASIPSGETTRMSVSGGSSATIRPIAASTWP